jgi:hypothetical protein
LRSSTHQNQVAASGGGEAASESARAIRVIVLGSDAEDEDVVLPRRDQRRQPLLRRA